MFNQIKFIKYLLFTRLSVFNSYAQILKSDHAYTELIWRLFFHGNALQKMLENHLNTIIHEVEKYSNDLIQKIELIHKECLAKVTTKSKTTDCIEDCKAKLQE